VEENVQLQVTNQRHVDFAFSTAELALTIDEFSARYLDPAMAVLMATVEADALSMYQDVYQQVGTAGTIPNTLKTLNQARAKLTNSLAPSSNRSLVMNTDAQVEIVDSIKGLFQDTTQIQKAYKEGLMGTTAGFGDVYENTLIPTHTNGTMGGTPLVNGASQTGTTLACDGVTAGNTWTKGTVFTIAGVFEVHPETKAVTNRLQQFVVTSTATFTGGVANVAISPAIVTTGARRTVSAAPADNAAITVVGTASTGFAQNMAFQKDAFVFATADLEKPEGVHFSARENYEGISLRIVRQYSISDDTIPCRIDILYGYKTVRPEFACRITA
jgi:hypothetical protein